MNRSRLVCLDKKHYWNCRLVMMPVALTYFLINQTIDFPKHFHFLATIRTEVPLQKLGKVRARTVHICLYEPKMMYDPLITKPNTSLSSARMSAEHDLDDATQAETVGQTDAMVGIDFLWGSFAS